MRTLRYLTTLASFTAVALTLAACSGAPDATGAGAGNGAQSSVTDDDNTRFVIPSVDNSNVTTSSVPLAVTNFTPADAQTYQFPTQAGVAGINAQIVLNSTPNACADANTNAYHAGESQLSILLTDLPDGRMVPGTYVFPAAADAPYEIASATYAAVTAPCTYNSVSLTAGQVQLTDVQYGSMSGTYSLTFGATTVTGSFTTAPSCTAVGTTPALPPNCP